MIYLALPFLFIGFILTLALVSKIQEPNYWRIKKPKHLIVYRSANGAIKTKIVRLGREQHVR